MKTIKSKKHGLTGINTDQGLYVLSAGKDGFICLGFDVCEKRMQALATELKIHLQDRRKGTAAHYYTYRKLVSIAGKKHKLTGWRSSSELNPKLIGLEGKRIEAILYGEKTRFIVGKSTGWIPCHLEIKTTRSMGGGTLPSKIN